MPSYEDQTREPKRHHITVNLTETEHRALKKWSEDHGKSMSELMAELLVSHMKQIYLLPESYTRS